MKQYYVVVWNSHIQKKNFQLCVNSTKVPLPVVIYHRIFGLLSLKPFHIINILFIIFRWKVSIWMIFIKFEINVVNQTKKRLNDNKVEWWAHIIWFEILFQYLSTAWTLDKGFLNLIRADFDVKTNPFEWFGRHWAKDWWRNK